jgi:hypothetical protein
MTINHKDRLMKHLLFTVLLLLVVMPVLGQDSPLDWYVYQANSTCETSIVVTGEGNVSTLTVELLYGDQSLIVGDVADDEAFETILPASTQWYGVAVRFAEQDRDAYRIEASLKCPLPVPTEDWAAIEADFFERVNWTQEEINWFHDVYTPLYGNPQGYILDQLELLEVLDTAQETPVPTNTPMPEATPQN